MIAKKAILALVLTAAGLVAVPQNASASVNLAGYLSSFDNRCPYRSGCTERVYSVTLTAGQTYVIDLQSNDFDAYLYLEGSSRLMIAQDDDSGGGLNARIVFRPLYTGTYYVVVTSFGPASGNFTLRVSP